VEGQQSSFQLAIGSPSITKRRVKQPGLTEQSTGDRSPAEISPIKPQHRSRKRNHPQDVFVSDGAFRSVRLLSSETPLNSSDCETSVLSNAPSVQSSISTGTVITPSQRKAAERERRKQNWFEEKQKQEEQRFRLSLLSNRSSGKFEPVGKSGTAKPSFSVALLQGPNNPTAIRYSALNPNEGEGSDPAGSSSPNEPGRQPKRHPLQPSKHISPSKSSSKTGNAGSPTMAASSQSVRVTTGEEGEMYSRAASSFFPDYGSSVEEEYRALAQYQARQKKLSKKPDKRCCTMCV